MWGTRWGLQQCSDEPCVNTSLEAESMTLRIKLLGLSVFGVLAIALVALGSTFLLRGQVTETIREQGFQAAASEASNAVEQSRDLIVAQRQAVEEKVSSDLSVAEHVAADHGGFGFDGDQAAQWDAVNQFTKEVSRVSLPQMTVGGAWFGQDASAGAQVPLVDEIQGLVGGTCTVFQRMNDSGDMLRIATNVLKLDGNRAIGTYIPASNPDGSANAVVQTVLRGETFYGRAFVVNAWYVTAYKPIFDATNEVVGVLYVGVQKESVAGLRDAIETATIGKSGEVFVAAGSGSGAGTYIIAPGDGKTGDAVTAGGDGSGETWSALFDEAVASPGTTVTSSLVTDAGEQKLAVTYDKDWDWLVAGTVPLGDYHDAVVATAGAVDGALLRSGAAMVVVAGVLGVLAFIGSGRIAKPIHDLTQAVSNIADGEGDLTKQITVSGSDESGRLAEAINRFIEKVRSLVSDISETSSQLGERVERLDSASSDIESGVNEQTSVTSRVAAAVEEIVASISEVAHESNNASEEAGAAGEQATSGGQIVRETVTGMEQIAEAVTEASSAIATLGQRGEQIGEILGVINDIADQTNLLALNAAIEAARAGEHGRGFAVVADEVRKLADRTVKATDEISSSIDAIRTETQQAVQIMELGTERVSQGVELASNAGDALDAIVSRSTSVSRMISSIASAAGEQSNAGESIAHGVASIRDQSGRVADSTRTTSELASELSQQYGDLQNQVARFKI